MQDRGPVWVRLDWDFGWRKGIRGGPPSQGPAGIKGDLKGDRRSPRKLSQLQDQEEGASSLLQFTTLTKRSFVFRRRLASSVTMTETILKPMPG